MGSCQGGKLSKSPQNPLGFLGNHHRVLWALLFCRRRSSHHIWPDCSSLCFRFQQVLLIYRTPSYLSVGIPAANNPYDHHSYHNNRQQSIKTVDYWSPFSHVAKRYGREASTDSTYRCILGLYLFRRDFSSSFFPSPLKRNLLCKGTSQARSILFIVHPDFWGVIKHRML